MYMYVYVYSIAPSLRDCHNSVRLTCTLVHACARPGGFEVWSRMERGEGGGSKQVRLVELCSIMARCELWPARESTNGSLRSE